LLRSFVFNAFLIFCRAAKTALRTARRQLASSGGASQGPSIVQGKIIKAFFWIVSDLTKFSIIIIYHGSICEAGEFVLEVFAPIDGCCGRQPAAAKINWYR
jgi:hypothetical protein